MNLEESINIITVGFFPESLTILAIWKNWKLILTLLSYWMDIHVFSFSFFKDLNMEFNPSDHPRASTIFLSKSQTDGRSLIYVVVFLSKKARAMLITSVSFHFLLVSFLMTPPPQIYCLMVVLLGFLSVVLSYVVRIFYLKKCCQLAVCILCQ